MKKIIFITLLLGFSQLSFATGHTDPIEMNVTNPTDFSNKYKYECFKIGTDLMFTDFAKSDECVAVRSNFIEFYHIPYVAEASEYSNIWFQKFCNQLAKGETLCFSNAKKVLLGIPDDIFSKLGNLGKLKFDILQNPDIPAANGAQTD